MYSPQVYLVHGSDDYLVAVKAQALVNSFPLVAQSPWALEVFDGRVTTVAEAVHILRACREAVQTMGLFQQGKVVWLKEAALLAHESVARSSQVRNALEAFLDSLRHGVPEGTTLVVSGPRLDPRHPLHKLCLEIGEVHDTGGADKRFQAEREARNELRRMLRQTGITMSPEAFEVFWEAVGPCPRLLANELDKLKTYLGERREATREDIEAVTTSSREHDAWQLADALGTRNLPRAVAVLRQLLFREGRNAEIGLLMALEARLRELLVYREALDRGWFDATTADPYRSRDTKGHKGWLSIPEDIRGILAECLPRNPLETHPYRATLLARQAQRFSLAELRRGHRSVVEVMEQYVSGEASGPAALEILLIRVLEKQT